MKNEEYTEALYSAVSRLLKPLVKILIRKGVSYAVFSEMTKRTYVDIADKDFKIPGKLQTNTRIATITGLSRKDVLRLQKQAQAGEKNLTDQHNRATRVISAWIREADFLDKRGRPAALPFEGVERSFTTLVKQFSGDIPPRTILDELIYSGSVKLLKDKRIQLVCNAYIPAADNLGKVRILGTDTRDLIATIGHNLDSSSEDAYFQRKVTYDNIPEDAIEKIKQIIVQKGQSALESMNKDMAKYDRDSNPDLKGTGRKRAGICIFYFEDNLDNKGDDYE